MHEMPNAIDLWIPFSGRSLPSDHGYAMFGALCRVLPELHDAPWWGLHTVRGQRTGQGAIVVGPGARLGLRLPAEKIPVVLPLAGQTLSLDGHRITLGPPSVAAILPAEAVSTRIATIKGALERDEFRVACERQLARMDVRAELQVGLRKVVRVGGRTVVGFSCRVSGLSGDASLALQIAGLGGRRRFGCGVFRPSTRPLAEEAPR